MTNVQINNLIDFRKYWNLDLSQKPNLDSIFMQISLLLSTRATCQRKQFGAVIVKDGRIISTGYNGSPAGKEECSHEHGCRLDSNGSCYDSIHAEANAIGAAVKNGIALNESSIYVKSIPCLPCAKLIVASGIKKYYLLDEDYRIKDGKHYLDDNNIEIIKLQCEII